MRRMHEYAANGYAFDLEENEDRIRRAAAPVRDATGAVKAAKRRPLYERRTHAGAGGRCAPDRRSDRPGLGWEAGPERKRNPRAA